MKSNTAASAVPELVTTAAVPGSPVVVVPSVIVAAVPSTPAGPVAPTSPEAPIGPVGPVGPISPVKPVGPVGPVSPVNPVAPVGPVDTIIGDSRRKSVIITDETYLIYKYF